MDDPITKHLLDYRKDTGDKITVYHLMTNSFGLADFDEYFGKSGCRLSYSKDEFVKKYCSGDLELTPGSKFKYCNAGYYLLGLILEQAGGAGFDTLLQDKIFSPLEMKQSGLEKQGKVIDKFAEGYNLWYDGFHRPDFINIDNACSAGGIYSTVDDLYKWDQALYSDKFLNKKALEKYLTPLHSDYACGWMVSYFHPHESSDSLLVYRHTGGIQGYNTIINRLPQDTVTVILLANISKVPLKEMTQAIFNIIYDKPYETPKKTIVITLTETIKNKGVAAGIAQYHSLKKDSSDYYSFVENELNALGYQLMEINLLDTAI